MNQPDMLYGAYMEEYTAEKTLVPTELPVTLRPLVYTYMIRYEFESGQQYVALARGALAGMAETVYLNDGHTGKTRPRYCSTVHWKIMERKLWYSRSACPTTRENITGEAIRTGGGTA